MTDLFKIKVEYVKEGVLVKTDKHLSFRYMKKKSILELKNFVMGIMRVRKIASDYDSACIKVTINNKIFIFWY